MGGTESNEIEVLEGEIVLDGEQGELSIESARELTKRIKFSHEALWHFIGVAKRHEIWKPLGYETWDEYRDAELSDMPFVPTKERRLEAILALRQHQMSAKDIEREIGVSERQVRRELDEAAKQGIEDPAGDVVIGKDGRQRKAHVPVPQQEDSPSGPVDEQVPGQTDALDEVSEDEREAILNRPLDESVMGSYGNDGDQEEDLFDGHDDMAARLRFQQLAPAAKDSPLQKLKAHVGAVASDVKQGNIQLPDDQLTEAGHAVSGGVLALTNLVKELTRAGVDEHGCKTLTREAIGFLAQAEYDLKEVLNTAETTGNGGA